MQPEDLEISIRRDLAIPNDESIQVLESHRMDRDQWALIMFSDDGGFRLAYVSRDNIADSPDHPKWSEWTIQWNVDRAGNPQHVPRWFDQFPTTREVEQFKSDY